MRVLSIEGTVQMAGGAEGDHDHPTADKEERGVGTPPDLYLRQAHRGLARKILGKSSPYMVMSRKTSFGGLLDDQLHEVYNLLFFIISGGENPLPSLYWRCISSCNIKPPHVMLKRFT